MDSSEIGLQDGAPATEQPTPLSQEATDSSPPVNATPAAALVTRDPDAQPTDSPATATTGTTVQDLLDKLRSTVGLTDDQLPSVESVLAEFMNSAAPTASAPAQRATAPEPDGQSTTDGAKDQTQKTGKLPRNERPLTEAAARGLIRDETTRQIALQTPDVPSAIDSYLESADGAKLITDRMDAAYPAWLKSEDTLTRFAEAIGSTVNLDGIFKPFLREMVEEKIATLKTEVDEKINGITAATLYSQPDARKTLEPLIKRVARNEVRECTPGIALQTIVKREDELRQARRDAVPFDDADSSDAERVQTWVDDPCRPAVGKHQPAEKQQATRQRTNDQKAQSVPEHNPSVPSDKYSSDSSDATSHKSDQSKQSEEAPVSPTPRPDVNKNLKERPYEADEDDLKTFREQAEETEKKDALSSMKPALEGFRKAVDFKTYRLINRSASYTPRMTGNLTRAKKKVDASMSSRTWTGKDKIGVLNFLENFKRACDSAGLHEGLAMHLFQFYVKEKAWNTIAGKLEAPAKTAEGRVAQRRAKKLTSWSLVVQRLLKKHADDQIIAEANGRVTSWHIPETMSEPRYADLLQERARKCGNVYSDRNLIEYFANGVNPLIQHAVRQYVADHPDKDLDDVARFAQTVPREHRNSRSDKGDRQDKHDRKDKENRSSNDRDRGSKSSGSSPGQKSQDSRSHRSRDRQPSAHQADSASEVNAVAHGGNAAKKSPQQQNPQCRFCLGRHDSAKCDHLKGMSADARDRLIQAREANYQQRVRTQSWSRPSNRGSSAQGSSSRAGQSVSFAEDEGSETESEN